MRVLLCCLLASCAATSGGGDHQDAGPVGFPTVTESLTLPGGEDETWTVTQLAREYGRLSRQQIMYSEDTATMLENARIPLESALVIEPGEVHSTVETLLLQAGFVLAVKREQSPRILKLMGLQSSERTNVREHARFVDREDLDSWAAHPAYVIHTVVTLENITPESAMTSMRMLMTDANTQQAIPIGTSNSMILTGFAPQVVEWVHMLETADAQSTAASVAAEGS